VLATPAWRVDRSGRGVTYLGESSYDRRLGVLGLRISSSDPWPLCAALSLQTAAHQYSTCICTTALHVSSQTK
jgi:hypothetical protein